MKKTLEGASIILQPRQPLSGIVKLGEAGVGVFPEGAEFLTNIQDMAIHRLALSG